MADRVDLRERAGKIAVEVVLGVEAILTTGASADEAADMAGGTVIDLVHAALRSVVEEAAARCDSIESTFSVAGNRGGAMMAPRGIPVLHHRAFGARQCAAAIRARFGLTDE